MRHKSGTRGSGSEKMIRTIKRKTCRQYSAEEKIRIVLAHILARRHRKGIEGDKFVENEVARALSKGKLLGFSDRRQLGGKTRSAIIRDSKSEAKIGLDFMGRPYKRLKTAYLKEKK